MKKQTIIQLLCCIPVAVSFFVLDFTLRYVTRWLGYYSIFELAPSLFSLCWIGIFMVILSVFPRNTGRIVYAVLYGIWAVYAVCQYVYYLIFNKFFFLSDMVNAGEGAAYMRFVLDSINLHAVIMVIVFLLLGILGVIFSLIFGESESGAAEVS